MIRYRAYSPTVTAILREDNDAPLGRVVAITETLGRGSWTTFVAYRTDGSRVGTGRTLGAAAELLAQEA